MTESEVAEAVIFEVRGGQLWRVKTRGRTGRERPCDPKRADLQRTDGYRRVTVGRRAYKAHRVVWLIQRGPIASAKEINHKNGKRGDNRVENLEVVTKGENLAHAYSDLGRPRQSGEKNGRSVLTRDQASAIRSSSLASRAEGKLYGVSKTTILKIRRGELWDEVPS
jgi:hypothetical protein